MIKWTEHASTVIPTWRKVTTHTLSLSLSVSHTHTHTHTLSLSVSHTHRKHTPWTHTHTHAHAHAHTHTLSLCLSHTHTHTHTISCETQYPSNPCDWLLLIWMCVIQKCAWRFPAGSGRTRQSDVTVATATDRQSPLWRLLLKIMN